jgi:ergothioneine biosynthesis protein EgtB
MDRLATHRFEPAAGARPLAEYLRVRSDSETLCRPLEIDDYGIQTMPEVSPIKWHLAHTSWFFETFLLRPFLPGYREFHPLFAHLFNSYYESVGSYHPRPQRGTLSRPTVAEITLYRRHVDEHMAALLQRDAGPDRDTVLARTGLGLHHEQQHQELMLTDIKHVFASNPLRPAYRELSAPDSGETPALEWLEYAGGVHSIGHAGRGFAFDNESPRHKVYVQDFRLASRPVTNGEFLEFIEAGGYTRPEYWLSDGWKAVNQHHWQAPLYWERIDGQWWHMTLGGLRRVDAQAPLCHISHYEAAAFAQWAGARLPTEAEWEIAAAPLPVAGNLRTADLLQPACARGTGGLQQMFGDVWEWTQSAYTAYPGYRAAPGALGEYNGKFMSSQMVLRGGSCVTPDDHIRPTYRNFFFPGDRWQFSGLRLARDSQ